MTVVAVDTDHGLRDGPGTAHLVVQERAVHPSSGPEMRLIRLRRTAACFLHRPTAEMPPLWDLRVRA
jgi:hypothetical protein